MQLEESLRRQLEELKTQIAARKRELYDIEQAEPENYRNPKAYEIYHAIDDLKEKLRETEKQLAVAPMKQIVIASQRSARMDDMVRHTVLALGAAALIFLAYLFKGSGLAAIPLFGLVALVVLWPVFEKFRNLEKISAVFRPGGIDFKAAATNTDDFLQLQSELARKKVELQLATVDRQIEDVRRRPSDGPRALDEARRNKEDTGPLFLGVPPTPTDHGNES